jgi:hypothetical protein
MPISQPENGRARGGFQNLVCQVPAVGILRNGLNFCDGFPSQRRPLGGPGRQGAAA